MISQTNTITLPQSGFVSAAIGIKNATMVGIWAPVVTSGNLFLQGTFEQTSPTSANFVRIADARSGGVDFVWPAAAGSNAIAVGDIVAPFPSIRLETSVAQTADRTFAITLK